MTWQGARKGVQISLKGRDSPDDQPVITPGKLADESKLGGLNDLMFTGLSIANQYSIPLKKRYREGWTNNENSTPQMSPVKEEIQDETKNGKTEICENNNIIFTLRDNSRRSRRKLKEAEKEDERACKGKRYLEFMGSKKRLNYTKNKTSPKKKLSKVQILKMNLRLKYFNTNPFKKEPPKTAKDKISQDHNLNLLADLAETALQKMDF